MKPTLRVAKMPHLRDGRQNDRVAEIPAVDAAFQGFDLLHAGVHDSPLVRDLWAQAMGDLYPADVEPGSSCSWWVLGHAVAALRLKPGNLLVDLGCGRGGPGMWLARALSTRLVGVDFSSVGVQLASSRAAAFGVASRAEFRRATFEHTMLADQSVDGAISMDALPFAPDRAAALREVRRILRPGGRLVFTGRDPRPGMDRWEDLADSAGLEMESVFVNEDHDDQWRRLYALWLAHEDEIRLQAGDRAADNFMREANQGIDRSSSRRALLFVMRRPRLRPRTDQ
jgi:ubiquinone/menaquinone biosynthesis C-methylase UbiE